MNDELLVIAKGIQKGKTTELLKMALDKKYVIVCPTRSQADGLGRRAKLEGFDINSPVSLDYLLKGTIIYHEVLLDNVEQMINKLTGARVKAFTVTVEEKS